MKIGNDIGWLNNIASDSEANKQVDSKGKGTFGQFYEAALNIYSDTNQYQVAADKAQLDFVSGKNDDMLTVMMAQEKAYASLNFTVQVTNKVIEAYREIMRIQI